MPTLKKTTPRPWIPQREAQSGRREKNTKFYASTAWRKLRAIKIKQDPICEECLRNGRYTPAQVVDHITPINQGGESLAMENLQSLCHPCHNAKSGREANTSRR